MIVDILYLNKCSRIRFLSVFNLGGFKWEIVLIFEDRFFI